MTKSLIDLNLLPFKGKLDEALKSLHQLTFDIKHDSLSETVSELRIRANEPFMFVIVGEVKVGKSSFINALLESKTEICKVAANPMTDTIQQIVYGDEYSVTSLSPVLKKISYPEEILKEIAIVDTPGTNTIIQHHQEITEKFIPSSDLIVFVFEAKNPYRQSAWDFFNYIKEDWHKKIIFVLQQKDLMDAEDLQINVSGLRTYAREKGIQEPTIFSVSAKQELSLQKELSGFAELREYIRTHITGGKASIFKLFNTISTASQINRKLKTGIEDRKIQYEYDIVFRKEIRFTLDDHERIAQKHVSILTDNLLFAYDHTTLNKRNELEKELGFINVLKRGIGGIFHKNQTLPKWLEGFTADFEKSLNLSMREKLESGVKDVSDSIQQMAIVIGLKIQNSKTILKNDHEVFSNIADKRSKVLEELYEFFQSFLKGNENYYAKDLIKEDSKLAPNVATGTGLALVGAIITALTHGAVFDITGGILTTVGILFAGITLGWNKRKILNQFDSEIKKGRAYLHSEVNNRLNSYIKWIKEKIDLNFTKLDDHLLLEKESIMTLEFQSTLIDSDLNMIQNDLKSLSNLEQLV